jgi:hypothetical protein
MSRQIQTPYQSPSSAELESRLRILELKVARLTEMVTALARDVHPGETGKAAGASPGPGAKRRTAR